MPGVPQQRPIKGLNNGPGAKRFVFKSFSQRIEEVDLDVFRSLAPQKSEPTGGTSFFHESLVSWRELNSAVEFTSIYEKLLPIVQTLPQLLLHKEVVMNTLLSHLQLSAAHSLEPILSLIAVLSRDLQLDFTPFIPRFLGACVELFQSGGDREPDIIEQVFTSLSYIFKYMQKSLCKDVNFVLKTTKRMRYYQRLYVQDFTAEAVSYLLRNCSYEQLIKGIRRLFTEVHSKPSKENIDSCSSLLWYTLKGPGKRLHSRAEPVLRLLLDKSTFQSARKKDPGGRVINKVLSQAFERLSEELDRKQLAPLWCCLLDELNSFLDALNGSSHSQKQPSGIVLESDGERNDIITTMDIDGVDSVSQKDSEETNGSRKRNYVQRDEDRKLTMANLLSLVNHLLEIKKGSQLYDFKPLFSLSHRLLESTLLTCKEEAAPSPDLVGSFTTAQAKVNQLPFQILRLFFNLNKSHFEVTGVSVGSNAIVSHAGSWNLLWNCSESSSLLYFVQGLLEHGSSSFHPFLPDILRTFDMLIYTHSMDILLLMMKLIEKMENLGQRLSLQKSQYEKLYSFVVSIIKDATESLRAGLCESTSAPESKEVALIWAALKCCSHLAQFEECDKLLVWNYVLALDHRLSMAEAGDCIKKLQEFLLATALSSELKVLSQTAVMSLSSRGSDILKLGMRYKDSPHVLKCVADLLDLCLREPSVVRISEIVPVELQEGHALSFVEKNLGSHSKLLRMSTLQLLVHLDNMVAVSGMDDSVVAKRRKSMDGRFYKGNITTSDSIFEQFRSLEAAPFSLETGRQSSLVLTRLKIKACSGNLPEHHLTSLTHALVGMLFNRFGLLWEGAVDCLSGLLETRNMSVWETFTHHLELCQRQFLQRKEKLHSEKGIDVEEHKSTERCLVSLMEHCCHNQVDSTDVGTVTTLLLRAAQKVPTIAEGQTRQIVPLFLTFVGHDFHSESSLAQSSLSYGGKNWKVVLKEWLILLSLMKNAQSYFKGSTVKEVLIKRFLMDGDPDIQSKVLECILNWKDSYLTPYEEHLKNLISPKMAREEMTTWNIGKESGNVQLNHRDGLVATVMRLLFPKILKTKTSLHNKTTGGVQRKVVLVFLASLDVQELALFFNLIFKPLESAFTTDGMECIQGDHAWELAIKQGVKPTFINWVDVEGTSNLSYKKKTGFLHMIKDVLETFDKEHVTPYLHALLAFSFRILEACQVNNGQRIIPSISTVADQVLISGKKDVRTLALKVLATVFSKYDDAEFYPVHWVSFFGTVRPMITRFAEEGASGDAPSALFSCFIAMSRSLVLASVLLGEKELVPNLLPLISHKNASTSIIGAALSFIENILALEDEDSTVVTDFFLPHLSTLLSNLMALLSSKQRGTSGRKLPSSVKRGLYILLKISKHISSSADAVQLLDVLLPYLLTHRKTNQGELVDVLHVLKELALRLNRESCEKTLPFLGQLLSSCPHLDVRSAICEVLSAFSLTDSAMSFVAGLISDLNALSASTIGEYDYECRLQAYGRLSAECFGKLTYEQAVLVILQASYDIGSDDISIRHSASNCLSNFVRFSTSICEINQLGIGGEMMDGGSSISKKGSLSACWDEESVIMAMQKVLLPNVRRSMSLDSLTVRREWVLLLREMASNLPLIPPLGELLLLINTDAEVDFFNNINHIQTHRRIRAMARFKELCCAGAFSQGTLVRIFEPLFTNSLFEGKGDKDGNLVQSAVEVIACIAARLQWDPYYSLLMRLFRMISSHPEYEKPIIKLLSSVLDKFHFNKEVVSGGGLEKMIGTEEEEQACKSPGIALVGSSIPEEILRQLKLRIFPEFMKLMVSKSNIINVSVAVAVVKVLQLMPIDVMELELPRIVQNVVNLLRNRSQTVRDEARAGLLAIVGVLGAGYFGFVVGKLHDSLKRGYEVHVLGFTLNALIAKIFPKLKIGEIDYCAEKVLSLLGNDIFEDVAEEKEVEKMAFKMKEIKRSGSYESLKLVAQIVTFHLHGSTLLNAVKRRLKDALVPKTKGRVERVLRQLALGIQLNASLKQEELFVFVHGLVEDGITEEKLGVRSVSLGIKSHVPLTTDEGTEKILNFYLITEFALQLLESHLKRAKLNKSDPALLSMLDPMVALLHSCLESKHGAILGLAMKCLCHLVRLPLPTIELLSADLLTKVLIMAQGFGKSENKTVQPCFNLLVALLKHAKGVHVSDDQIRTILQFPIFDDLEKAESNTGLVLLKAIVGRKCLVPELYDIINRVSQLMVTSHVAVVRQYCSQTILQFLLDYPLGSKRLQQHLDFFIANLSYENAPGREAVLEMLHAIIVKFPVQAVDEQLETFFLPLVTRLVNDDSNQLRAMVGTVLKVLMGRVSQRLSGRMLKFCFSWLRGDKQHLWRAAGQVLGFAVEVMKDKYLLHVEDSLTLSFGILNHVLDINCVEKKEIMTVGPVLWQEAYHILTMLEKLLKQFSNVCIQRSCEGLWEIIYFFLLHQHVWVRKASSRLLSVYFTACYAADNSTETAPLGGNGQQAFLLQPSRLMLLAAVLCQQLSSELDEGLAELLEKNLLFASVTLHSAFFDGKDKLSWMDLVCEKDAATEARVANALGILKVRQWISKEGANAGRTADDPSKRNKEVVKGVNEGTLKEARYYGLSPVFKYLERVSLQANDLQMKTVFRLYASFLTSLGNDRMRPYLSSILLPLYRSVEALAAKIISDDVKILAESVLNQIRETFGTEEFVQAYNETRKMTRDARETRRRAKKLKVLVDPEGNARRKLKLNVKRQAQKKNKRKKAWQEHCK